MLLSWGTTHYFPRFISSLHPVDLLGRRLRIPNNHSTTPFLVDSKRQMVTAAFSGRILFGVLRRCRDVRNQGHYGCWCALKNLTISFDAQGG